jgi:hypothetical protein
MTVARTFEEYEDLVQTSFRLLFQFDRVMCAQAMALLMRPSALARARTSLRNCRTECNLFRTRDVWVPNWEVSATAAIDCTVTLSLLILILFFRLH